MSNEVQIAHPCPHLILEEPVTLGADRRSLTTRAPVGGSNVARVFANDVSVPQTGLYAQATLTGDVGGPFRVAACDTSVTVQSSTGSVTFDVPSGSRVAVEDVVKLFRGNIPSVAVEVYKGHLTLTDASSVGAESSLRVSGPGGAAIGFAVQRGARGRKVYPGWDLVTRPDTVVNRFPRFREVVQPNPSFKASYVTVPARCIRCGGRFIENDYRFDLEGEVLTVRDDNLLYQSALKILLTRIRSNPFHPGYGSSIESRLGTKAIGAVATLITEDVQNALSYLQRTQTAQAKYQNVSPRERLFSVLSVRVSPQENDPTVFILDVVVSNASSEPVSLTIVFSVPGAAALVGTNGLSLGLEPTGLTDTQAARIFR